MTIWFAYQRCSFNKPEPVLFYDERPISKADQKRVIPDTLKRVPTDLAGATIAQIVERIGATVEECRAYDDRPK
jgi:hypothetical protein